jgi:hypothetical protein
MKIASFLCRRLRSFDSFVGSFDNVNGLFEVTETYVIEIRNPLPSAVDSKRVIKDSDF